MDKVVIVGAGVAGINAATKLVDNNYKGQITIIDMGKDPYNRLPEEVMCGYAGAGLFSDGKYTYLSNSVGGHLTKYCGEEKAQNLVDQGFETLKRFHPDSSKIMFSSPIKEPEFIKPHFNLKMASTYHIGTNYLHELGKNWYDYLVEKGVHFEWETKVTDIDFKDQCVFTANRSYGDFDNYYDILLYGTGKSGIDITQNLIDKYDLKKESKPIQLGVRMELPQKYTQKILDVAYDFKLYQKPNNKISLRTFCTNANAAYVAEEETYGMKSYNGHSFKDESLRNNMNNFGILMEIKDIKDPFKFQKEIVSKCQIDGKGLYYSPNKTRKPSKTAEGDDMNLVELDNLNIFKETYGEYADYIISFIDDLNKIFKFGDDFGLYIPEVKFLSEEVLVQFNNLSLIDYPNVHFMGDSLSARGIAVSSGQGIYVSTAILRECGIYNQNGKV